MRLIFFLFRLLFMITFLEIGRQVYNKVIIRFRRRPRKRRWEDRLYPPVNPELAEDGDYKIVE